MTHSVMRSLGGFLYTVFMLPFFWVAWFGLLVTRLYSEFRTPAASPKFAPLPEAEHRKATLVVLSWNGRHLLEENLPSVITAARHKGANHDVLVVDNGSSDGTLEFLRERFPGVQVLALPHNLGFGEGNNAGVAASRQPIVVLLNNDMRVDPDFLGPLLDHFDDSTFAVSSQILFADPAKPREETGKTAVRFAGGWFRYAHESVSAGDERRGELPVFWAGGGSSAFHRDKFLWLGGFDRIYSPCYVEDTDISYRAWKMGWKVLFAPGSRVHHFHRASSSRRFTERALEDLILRNQLLFAWTNLFDWKGLLIHGLLFPWAHFRKIAASEQPSWGALPRALAHLPAIMWRRLRRAPPRRTDAQIFRACEERFRHYYGAVQPAEIGCRDRLRILMVTAYLPHLGYHAGAGRMFHLIRRLAERHDVSVVSFLESEEEHARAEPLRRICQSVRLLLRRPDYIRSLYVYEPFDAFYSTSMRRLILETLEEQVFDLIHYEYAQMGRYYLPDCPVPQLFTEHEVNYQACRIQSRISRSAIQKAGWFYNYMQVMQRETAVCRGMSKVICMTPEDATSLAGLVPMDRLAVVRTGVDLEYFQPMNVLEAENSLVFVGSFQHQPNCDAMLYFTQEILPRIRKEIPAVTLSIVGSKPPAEIVRLAASEAVKVSGYVEDLRPYLSQSSLFIVPLRLGVGIRGKILEAWAMQRPVIATSLACSGLPARHRENLWIADSSNEFAAGIIHLLRDVPERQRLAAEGRRCAVDKFGWESSTNQLDRVYRRVVNEHRRSAPAMHPELETAEGVEWPH